jgi:hypothetical protein
MSDFFSSLFVNQINSLCQKDPSFASVYKEKVRGKIIAYGRSINVSINDLKVIQVADDRGSLHKDLVSFIKNFSPRSESTPERIKKYRGEIYSDVERVVSGIFNQAINEQSLSLVDNENLSGSFLERQCPEWMAPLLAKLGRTTKLTGRCSPQGAARLKYPLTSMAVELLDVLLRISRTNSCSSLESLLVDSRFDIHAELKTHYSGNQYHNLLNTFNRLRGKLGFSLPARVLESIPFEKWPVKLQEQWKVYETGTKNGVPKDSTLAETAVNFSTPLNQSSQRTIDNHKTAISIGLFHCQPFPDDFGVQNFLALEERKVIIGGVPYPEFYNQFVDRYRSREMSRQSVVKRVGFSSMSFNNFKTGLSVVAAFNGFFPLIKPFARAYQQNNDVGARRDKKDVKKQLYSIDEIDENIARLELEFIETVKNQSFERCDGVSTTESDKKMRLCLFYPIFITLRYLGLRKRNVKNFRLMLNPENRKHPEGNVGFRKDNTLVIHFTEKETKNKKALHLEFNMRDHAETHGVLIRGLKMYYKKVYPYILQNATTTLDRQFFAQKKIKVDGSGRFAVLPNITKAFDGMFIWSANEFLTFKKVNNRNQPVLNPHHLRGTCVDWLVDVVKCELEEAAEYVADLVDTLRNEYQDRHRIHNATSTITRRNRDLRAAKQEAEATENARRVAEQEKIETARRIEREDYMQKQMDRMEQTMNRVEASNFALEAKLAASEARADSLAAENARLTELLLKKMGADAASA